jgi:hypothetical protein
MMNFLRKLFGGQSGGGDREGLYFYIQSDHTGEVIQVRLHRYNDLSSSDNYDSFYAHKIIVGQKSFERIEANFAFNQKRELAECEIKGGKLVDRSAYEAYLAQSQEASR